MELTSERVDSIFRDCLFTDGEDTAEAVKAEGIIHTYGFHPGRLLSHRPEIRKLLMELPESFRKSSGGGWSFLQSCDDRHGTQWTGLHLTMEQLMCLGIATGDAEYLLPRDLWSALPGGMPYFRINDDRDRT